jgi:hypothetical protein
MRERIGEGWIGMGWRIMPIGFFLKRIGFKLTSSPLWILIGPRAEKQPSGQKSDFIFRFAPRWLNGMAIWALAFSRRRASEKMLASETPNGKRKTPAGFPMGAESWIERSTQRDASRAGLTVARTLSQWGEMPYQMEVASSTAPPKREVGQEAESEAEVSSASSLQPLAQKDLTEKSLSSFLSQHLQGKDGSVGSRGAWMPMALFPLGSKERIVPQPFTHVMRSFGVTMRSASVADSMPKGTSYRHRAHATTGDSTADRSLEEEQSQGKGFGAAGQHEVINRTIWAPLALRLWPGPHIDASGQGRQYVSPIPAQKTDGMPLLPASGGVRHTMIRSVATLMDGAVKHVSKAVKAASKPLVPEKTHSSTPPSFRFDRRQIFQLAHSEYRERAFRMGR